MKAERAFIAERPAAQHCAELLRPARPKSAAGPSLDPACKELARTLPAIFAPLFGGIAPQVRYDAPREAALTDQPSWNVLLGLGAEARPLLLSFEVTDALRLVERAFGGRGSASPATDTLPLSVELLITRLAAQLAPRIAQAFEADSAEVLRRDADPSRLLPPGAVIAATFEVVGQGESDGSRFTLAMPASSSATPARRTSADPAAPPFASVPLPLTAVLVEMAVPLATIAALEPGAVLPVVALRRIPLRIGGITIAHGSIGTLEESAALQITDLA